MAFLAPRTRPDRLTERRQFDAVLAHDWIIAGRYFAVRARPSELLTPRLGIIAARRAIRRAVDRNTCKRMVREAFRERKESLGGVDVVVVCRAAVSGNARPHARRELVRLLSVISENSARRAASGSGTHNFREKQ